VSATGGLRESAGPTRIEQSLRIILGTNHGERVMRPRFGCNLKALAFAPLNVATLNLARHQVEEGIRAWEPRVDVIEVIVEPDNRNGVLLIHVHYRVKATQDVRSLVYPFYLEPPT
jgi:hypothetical protein